jgi:hypothetical protein
VTLDVLLAYTAACASKRVSMTRELVSLCELEARSARPRYAFVRAAVSAMHGQVARS